MSAGDLTRLYTDADPATLQAGRDWYPSATREARRLAREHASTPHRAAGVLAAMSPRAQWSVNVRWADAILAAAADGAPCPPVGLGANRAKAWRIAHGERPLTVLAGPKVRAFYRAIVGDRDALTLDVWALRAAGWNRASVPADGSAARLEIEAAYRHAAATVGEPVRDFQAIVWLAVRGVKPTDGEGFRPTLPVGLSA